MHPGDAVVYTMQLKRAGGLEERVAAYRKAETELVSKSRQLTIGLKAAATLGIDGTDVRQALGLSEAEYNKLTGA